jgi:coenzyme F420-reducing hydrogenase beta subunit
MWRNYFFAHEGCLYCPDFYGADADISFKDAWGAHSRDPLGKSMLIVRNPGLTDLLEELRSEKKDFIKKMLSGRGF